MSATTTTFKAMMEGMARARIGTGSTISDEIKFILADALSNAMQTCWEMPAGQSWVWPWTVTTNSAATLTNGAIPYADLDYCRWFAVYSADPRGSTSTAYPIPAYADGDGIHPMDSTLSTYFVFYIPRAPEYTSTLPVVATAYATDDIVYDDTSRSGGTGHCFRCVAGYTSSAVNATLTTELATTSIWQEQKCYKNFQDAATQLAFAQWLETKREFQEARIKAEDGMNELEQQFKAVRRQPRYGISPYYATGTWR